MSLMQPPLLTAMITDLLFFVSKKKVIKVDNSYYFFPIITKSLFNLLPDQFSTLEKNQDTLK